MIKKGKKLSMMLLTAMILAAGSVGTVAGTGAKQVQAAENIQDAVNKVFAMADREDVILSFGSLSFIGEITTIVKNREEKNL